MKEIEYGGTTYLQFSNTFVEKDTYIIPNEIVLKELSKIYYSKIDFSILNDKELIEYIKDTKTNFSYTLCLKASLLFYERHKQNSNDVRSIMPIITSLYRKLNEPKKAIEIYNEAFKVFGMSIFSVPLYTSIAAAYCDLKEFEKAKQFCDIAYAKQGGGIGTKTELSLVYLRIQKETQ